LSTPAAKAVPAVAGLSTREQYGVVLGLSLPIIAALTSQNLLNLVDTWIVGRLGSLALAAVALAGTINWVISSFFMGLGAGVQALVSRRVGENDMLGAVGALNRTLTLTAFVVVPLAVLATVFSDVILAAITSRDDVHLVGVPYLAARLAGLPFVAANFAFRGYWNGLGLSRVYLRTLIVIHIANVAISYVLVFGLFGFPAMGVFGAGVGSTVAQAIGTAYYLYLARRLGGSEHFLSPNVSCSLKNLLKLGAPAGIQTLLFSLGFLVFFTITDRLGAKELGASQVLVTMALVSILPAVGFGLGAASLIGQALGAGRKDDAARWGWLTLYLGVGVVGLIGAAEALTAGWWMEMFIPADPAAAALGTPALRIIGAIMVVDAVGVILSNSLIGAGATRQVMVVSVVTQWGVFLPLGYVVAFHFQLGLMGLWAAFAFYRVLFAAAMLVIWRAGKWKDITV
jgi:MATE family multidrug resistance protein